MQTCDSVAYRELWPGIDLVYSGTFERLKYAFEVKPGADPEQIRLAYPGAGRLVLFAIRQERSHPTAYRLSRGQGFSSDRHGRDRSA